MTKRFSRLPACFFALVLALAAGMLGLAAPASASDLPDPRDPKLGANERLEALVERIKIEQEKIRTLEARFVQKQDNEFLAEAEESRGVFSYRSPDRVRWEYQEPKPITMMIDERTMTTWYRDLDRVEELQVGKYSERILRYLGAGNSMSELMEYFDVRAAWPKDRSKPYRLELTPRFKRIEKRLRHLTIWVDPELYVPQRLLYVGGDGGTTEYVFEDLKINAGIPDDRFALDLPDTVERRVVSLDRAQ